MEPPHSDLMLRSEGLAKGDDEILPPEGDDLTTDDALLGVAEKLGPMQSIEPPSPWGILEDSDDPNCHYEPNCNIEFDPFPESSRDCRHVGDLTWHGYYRMSQLGETVLPPMRYTLCDPSTGQQCWHRTSPVLQIFDMKLQTCLLDATAPVEVYGIVAVRDDEDYRRNYLFNRSRDNPLAINPTGDHLRLMSPKRAMSVRFDCLIEVDIRVKTKANSAEEEDITLVDGCMDFIEDRVSLRTLYKCSSYSPYGVTRFDMIIFESGVEATVQLEFSRVPPGGFDLRMYGHTSIHKNVYTFIDKNRECSSFVNAAGRHPQLFVAAVEVKDTLNIGFADGGQPLPFKAAIHGSEKQVYCFEHGAVVSVMVCWSTVSYVGDKSSCSDAFVFSDFDDDDED